MGQNQSEPAQKQDPSHQTDNNVASQFHSDAYPQPGYQPAQNGVLNDSANNQSSRLMKSRSTNNSQQQFNSMSQSIPNLRSFVENRQQNEGERNSDAARKPPFQKQNGKHPKRGDNSYKKNLYSAMTSRVLKQQQDNQLNNSQMLHSQRSLTSLSMNQQQNMNTHSFQRLQSPIEQRHPGNFLDISQTYDKQNFDSSFVNNYHNPISMKKQYSQGVTNSNKKAHYIIGQDFSVSTQIPPQEQFMQNNMERVNMGPQIPQQNYPPNASQQYSESFINGGQNDQFIQGGDLSGNLNMKILHQQLYQNYEKAMNLNIQQKYSPLKQSPPKFNQSVIQKYDSHQQMIDTRNGMILQSPEFMNYQDSYASQKPTQQMQQFVRDRDSFPQLVQQNSNNPPYKIRTKNSHSQISPDQLMNNSMRMHGFSQIKREIKFGGSNCPIEPSIAILIILYDMPNFRKYLCLTPEWHHLVLEAMDEYFKKVECDFVMKNYEYLLFKKSYTNSSIIQFCGQKGIRVDRVIQCEVLDNSAIINKCLRISYSYKYTNATSEKDIFVADFKLDVTKPNHNRLIWVHKDEQEQLNQQRQYQISEDLLEILRRPYVQPITQICAKDTIEIAINLYCLQGLVDIESIEWLDCSTTIPPKINVLNYDKDVGMRQSGDKAQKIYCDMSRICELEDAVVEWYESKYFQRQDELLNIEYLSKLFTVKRHECAGIDGLICKIQLTANKEGRLYNEFLGIPIVVKNTKNRGHSLEDEETLINEVKRLGLLIDRYVDLELRIGDTLVIYISRGSS